MTIIAQNNNIDIEFLNIITEDLSVEYPDKTISEIEVLALKEYKYLEEAFSKIDFETPFSFNASEEKEQELLKELDDLIQKYETIYKELKLVPLENLSVHSVKEINDTLRMIEQYIKSIENIKHQIKKKTKLSYLKKLLYIYKNNLKITSKAYGLFSIGMASDALMRALNLISLTTFKITALGILALMFIYIYYQRETARYLNTIILTAKKRRLTNKEIAIYREKINELNKKYTKVINIIYEKYKKKK